MVIKVRSRSPETPQCVIIAIERISRGTRTTLTGCNGAIFIEVEYKKDDGKKKRSKLYLLDFGRPSDRLHCAFRNPEDTVRNSAR
jgi:hypothetical protein